MRFIILLLVFLLVSACAHISQPSVPGYVFLEQHTVQHGWSITHSDGKYSDEQVAVYTQTFIDLWQQENFPQNSEALKLAFNTIEIHWQDGIFTYANSDSSKRLLGLTYHGLKPDKIVVFVATSPHSIDIGIEQSAYGHELIHIALGAITGDPARNHLQDENAMIWPREYENFLVKVAKEYRKRMNENSRTD